MATSNTTIAKNTVFLSIRMVFVLIVSLYTSRVFLHALGVVDFGVNNVVGGFVSMFAFLNTALSNGIQRFYNAEMSKNGVEGVRKVYNTSLLIQGGIALIILILLETFGLWYFYNKMVIPADRMDVAFWIYQIATVSSVMVVMQAPYVGAIMAYEKMDFYAICGILDVLLKLGIALAIPHIPFDKLMTFGILSFGVSVVNFCLYFSYSKRKFKALKAKRFFEKKLFKDMISFSGWNFLGTFACMIREQGLNMVLNLFFGPVVNAARGVAYQVSSALQGFVSNLSVAAKPQMVSSYSAGDSTRTMKLMFSMSKLSFFFLLIFAVPVILEVDYILHLWLGDVVPEHTSNFIILVILTNFVNNLNAPLSNVVYATGKMRNYELTFSIINILILPISYIALKMGAAPEAAFLVYFIMTIFVQIGCLIVLRTLVHISLREYFVRLCVPLLAVFVISFILPWLIHGIMAEGFLRLVIVTFASLIISTFAFYFLGLAANEKAMVNNAFESIKAKFIKK